MDSKDWANFAMFSTLRESRRTPDPAFSRVRGSARQLHPFSLGSEVLQLLQRWGKTLYLLIIICCWAGAVPVAAYAHAKTLVQSVEQAFAYSPQLKAQTHRHKAVEHDLKQSRAGYRPSVDLELGYGSEQHSDRTTRLSGADPGNDDWDSKGDATLRLTQKVYDGGETRQHVSIRKALLDSANFGIQETTQAIALNAINAHLDVYRQRVLMTLAEKDFTVHQDIFNAISEMSRAGMGNVADVTQTRARMAQAQSILITTQSDLNRAVSNYERVVGEKPGKLAFAEVPKPMPGSLAEALKWMEQKNPQLLSYNARLLEAGERVALARTHYKPKINIE
ncbi:MAG: TolC family protein, partial [Desulfobacterales bacterium]|nr:TolC family protein [Desulfobacterales bacterium]